MPTNTKSLPLTVSFINKWDPEGAECILKARCFLHGDLMHAVTHYDTMETQCPTVDKTTGRLLLALATVHGCPIEHMDIFNAYVHAPSMYETPLFLN